MSPEISILLVTSSADAIARVARGYAAGVDPQRIELVVSVVGGARLPPAELRGFGYAHVVVVDGGTGRLDIAEERAVRSATAPYVVIAEAHVWPRPGYVDAVLAAFAEGDWTVIGPAVANPNPKSPWSRAAAAIDFGRWRVDSPRGEMADVMAHHSTYRREVLLALGQELRRVLPAGWALQLRLARAGHRAFFEPRATVEDFNCSDALDYLRYYFKQGRQVMSQRCRDWSLARRVTYAIGSPLIPLVRGWRLRSGVPESWRLLPWLAVGLVASAIGELAGFLGFGSPPTVENQP